MTRTLTRILIALLSLTALAAKTSDIAATSTISDYDSTGTAYYVQSDGLYGGGYSNGVAGTQSVLQAAANWAYLLNTYNSSLSASGGRNGLITLEPGNQESANATLPSIWSGWGTHLDPIRIITHGVECDLLTIKPGNPLACPVLLRFGPSFGSGHSTSYYRLDMLGTCTIQQCGFTEPETQEPLISCNAQDASGNCNDWSMDSTPPTSQSGGVPINKLIARLSLVSSGGGGGTSQGDFYLTFHIHVTNP
jgi:hypothetical protein